MSDKPMLKLDWCSHAAAKYAVEHWHYSKRMPAPPLVKIGCWEAGQFRGCIVFGRGANKNLCRRYAIQITDICELTRIALTTHQSPVSRMVRIAIALLRATNSGLRLVVSYADPSQGHHGGIYQALGWIYDGQSREDFAAIDRTGRRWHSRQVSATGVKRQFGQYYRVPKLSECTLVPLLPKYRYLYPLNAAMRAQIAPLALPYPKRATSIVADASAHQAEEGGSTPTVALRVAPVVTVEEPQQLG
jgi:hypothetical protein